MAYFKNGAKMKRQILILFLVFGYGLSNAISNSSFNIAAPVFNGIISSSDSRRASFDRLKKTKSCPSCDLRDMQMIYEDLSNANLLGTDLSGANAISANFSGSNMQNTKLSFGRFNLAMLNDANLSKSECLGTIFRNSYLNGASFENADLTQAVLNGSEAIETKFINTILTKGDLQNINAARAIFKNAQAEYVIADRANFDFTDMTGMNGRHISFANASLQQTILDGADFTEGNFEYTNLFRSTTAKTNFTSSTFKWAILTGVDLSEAILTGSDFSFANLYDSKITPKQLETVLLCNTRMPDDSLNNRDCDKIATLQKEIIAKNEAGKEVAAAFKKAEPEKTATPEPSNPTAGAPKTETTPYGYNTALNAPGAKPAFTAGYGTGGVQPRPEPAYTYQSDDKGVK